jgi:hypothetical protein
MNLSEIQILYYLSLFIWLFPPIRQYKKRLFFFFLVLAVTDPIVFVFQTILHNALPQLFSLFVSYCLLVCLLEKSTIKKYKYWIIVLAIILLVVSFIYMLPMNIYLSVLFSVQILIFIVIMKIFILEYVAKGKLSIFYLMLVLYQLTMLLKFYNYLAGFTDAGAFFVITTIAQNFFGLFFSFVRENKQEPAVQS